MNRALAICVLLAVLVFPVAAQGLEFASKGKLDQLQCKILKRQPLQGWASEPLLVEVRNRNRSWAAEPLVFRCTVRPKGAKPRRAGRSKSRGKKKDKAKAKSGPQVSEQLLPRASFPMARRYGRPVPAGGRNRYWLQVGLAYNSKSPKLTIEVAQASWFRGRVPKTAPVAVGKVATVKRTNIKQESVTVATATVSNTGGRPMDAVFLATFTQPKDNLALFAVRLEPGEERVVNLPELPSRLTFDRGAPWQNTRISKVELVDWCWVATNEGDDAQKVFLKTYARWVRWQSKPAFSGRFEYTDGTPKKNRRGRGRFSLLADGAVRVELDASVRKRLAGNADRYADAAQRTIEVMLREVRRPSSKELAEQNRFRTVGDGVIEVLGPGFRNKSGWKLTQQGKGEDWTPNYVLRDGRIVQQGDRNSELSYYWETKPMGSGFVVTRRRNKSSQYYEVFGYGRLGDLVVPVFYHQHFGFPGTTTSEKLLSLSGLQQTGAVVAKRDSKAKGPGVEALRAAWQSGFRYPQERRRLTARFEVKTPGTDFVWYGQTEVRGKVELSGYRGFMMDGSGWRGMDVQLPAGSNARVELGLSQALSDRFLLWLIRDFNGRRDFDVEFHRATVSAPTKEGVIKISGARYKEVWVKGGRIVRSTSRNGLTRRYSWSKVGKQFVITRVRTGEEDLKVKFSKVGDTLVPTNMTFERVFGRDWGPEKIRLLDVKLRE